MPALPHRQFNLYLKSQGASRVTVKNYLSDLNHFWAWFLLALHSQAISLQEDDIPAIVGQITPLVLENYKSFLIKNGHPVNTINRRLSSLRRFSQFSISQGWLKTDPAQELTNLTLESKNNSLVEKILLEFKNDLKKEAVSPITIKNYLSDLRQFLAWIGWKEFG